MLRPVRKYSRKSLLKGLGTWRVVHLLLYRAERDGTKLQDIFSEKYLLGARFLSRILPTQLSKALVNS